MQAICKLQKSSLKKWAIGRFYLSIMKIISLTFSGVSTLCDREPCAHHCADEIRSADLAIPKLEGDVSGEPAIRYLRYGKVRCLPYLNLVPKE